MGAKDGCLARSSSSSEDSTGVTDGVRSGLGCERGDWENRRVCLTVGEVRKGSVRGFCNDQVRKTLPHERET